MNPLRQITAVAALSLLCACGTVMQAAHSGFLTDYSALVSLPDSPEATRAAQQPIDATQVVLGDIEWRVPANADIDDGERDALVALLRAELLQRVQALPTAPQGRPVVVRAAITRVSPVSPGLNTVGTLLLIGPLDRGGAAIEIEALDAQRGQQLAALTLGYFAPLSELKARFSKLAPAEIAVRKAVADFVPLLQGGSPVIPASAQR